MKNRRWWVESYLNIRYFNTEEEAIEYAKSVEYAIMGWEDRIQL